MLTEKQIRGVLCSHCAAGREMQTATAHKFPPTRGLFPCTADADTVAWLLEYEEKTAPLRENTGEQPC